MEYDIVAPVGAGTTADPEWMTTLARHVESLGFASLVVVEHALLFTRYESAYPYSPDGRVELAPDCDLPDPLELLAFLAGRTSTLGLATGVPVLPDHHPVLLAKRLATLDRLSGGRLRLCVGMGWLREEIEACGTDFATRGRRADEQLAVLRALWSGEPTTHDGEFFSFADAVSRPTPVQARVPVLVGGHSVAAARRAGRFGDGLQPLGVTGERLGELKDEMARAAESVGRDPGALELALGHAVTAVDGARAEKLASLGATRIVLAMPDARDVDEACAALSDCAERLSVSS